MDNGADLVETKSITIDQNAPQNVQHIDQKKV